MQTITMIPGDGIGPEIADSVKTILSEVSNKFTWETIDLSQAATMGLPKELFQSIEKTKVAIKGPTTTPVGSGHRSLNVAMRQQFNLYANVRPVKNIPGVPVVAGDVDMIIVRENTEDLYMGVEYKIGNNVAHGIKVITAEASLRICRYAFDMARKLGRKKVTAVHKANIMKLTDGLFLDCFKKVASEYADIASSDIIIDNCCMQLATKPSQFDVLVTENLYGDIISDLGAGLIGGLGVAAGSNIGSNCAIFEAVHGSAPDIAGKNLAKPTALILSAVMMLEHLGDLPLANMIRNALHKTIANPETRTKDLGGKLSTTDFTKAVINNLSRGTN
jgi:isocitrate dehydrogenase (NAD+)